MNFPFHPPLAYSSSIPKYTPRVFPQWKPFFMSNLSSNTLYTVNNVLNPFQLWLLGLWTNYAGDCFFFIDASEVWNVDDEKFHNAFMYIWRIIYIFCFDLLIPQKSKTTLLCKSVLKSLATGLYTVKIFKICSIGMPNKSSTFSWLREFSANASLLVQSH